MSFLFYLCTHIEYIFILTPRIKNVNKKSTKFKEIGDKMNYFSKNLGFLTRNHINQNQLSIKLGLSRQTIQGYLKQNKEPKYDLLIQISEIYNVTIDDLLKKDLSKE